MKPIILFFAGFVILGFSLMLKSGYTPIKTVESDKSYKLEAVCPKKHWKNEIPVKDIQDSTVEATYYICSFYYIWRQL